MEHKIFNKIDNLLEQIWYKNFLIWALVAFITMIILALMTLPTKTEWVSEQNQIEFASWKILQLSSEIARNKKTITNLENKIDNLKTTNRIKNRIKNRMKSCIKTNKNNPTLTENCKKALDKFLNSK